MERWWAGFVSNDRTTLTRLHFFNIILVIGSCYWKAHISFHPYYFYHIEPCSHAWLSLTVAQGWVCSCSFPLTQPASVSQPQGYNREQKGSRCISWYKWMIQRMYISAGAWSSHLKHNVFKTKEQPGNIEWHMIKFNVYFPFSSGLVSKPWGKYLAGFLAAECSSVFSYRHFVCLRLLLGRYYSAGL